MRASSCACTASIRCSWRRKEIQSTEDKKGEISQHLHRQSNLSYLGLMLSDEPLDLGFQAFDSGFFNVLCLCLQPLDTLVLLFLPQELWAIWSAKWNREENSDESESLKQRPE